MRINRKKIKSFQKKVYTHYETHGRDLPWRKTKDPYRILVSEMMLQQTQVDRVIPKYDKFIKRFPDLCMLARARLKTVIKIWQGLGYNRRAKFIHDTSRLLMIHNACQIPSTEEELLALPGIGEYTANAILVFAFETPKVLIETNIRSAIIYDFFPKTLRVHDKDIKEVVDILLDNDNPRAWYYALMDYGAYIKKSFTNPNRKSTHYYRQKSFKGSNRQLRGAILRHLLEGPETFSGIASSQSGFSAKEVKNAVMQLVDEGIVKQDKKELIFAL